jgi:hypothetical protein
MSDVRSKVSVVAAPVASIRAICCQTSDLHELQQLVRERLCFGERTDGESQTIAELQASALLEGRIRDQIGLTGRTGIGIGTGAVSIALCISLLFFQVFLLLCEGCPIYEAGLAKGMRAGTRHECRRQRNDSLAENADERSVVRLVRQDLDDANALHLFTVGAERTRSVQVGTLAAAATTTATRQTNNKQRHQQTGERLVPESFV